MLSVNNPRMTFEGKKNNGLGRLSISRGLELIIW
jgi:hypothetical protein